MNKKFETGITFARIHRREIREILLSAESKNVKLMFLRLLEYASKHDCDFIITSGQQLTEMEPQLKKEEM